MTLTTSNYYYCYYYLLPPTTTTTTTSTVTRAPPEVEAATLAELLAALGLGGLHLLKAVFLLYVWLYDIILSLLLSFSC